jgi:hypothetical protein
MVTITPTLFILLSGGDVMLQTRTNGALRLFSAALTAAAATLLLLPASGADAADQALPVYKAPRTATNQSLVP